MAMTIAGIIILILAAGIFLYWFLYEFGPFAEQGIGREACRDSVFLRTQGKIAGYTTFQELSCKIRQRKIKTVDEENIKKAISEEMYDCWYQFGEGKKDFLTDRDWGTGDNWCFICSRIEFENRVKEEVPQINGLMNYLDSTPVPFYDGSFFNYFYGTEGDIGGQIFENDVYVTNAPLYVAFFGDKKVDSWIGLGGEAVGDVGWTAIVGGIVGCVVGGVAGGTGGSVVPIAGTIAGFVAGCQSGGSAGFYAGAILGGGKAVYDVGTHKESFYTGLYVGNSDEVLESCNQ